MPASFEGFAAALRGLWRDRRPLWRLLLGLRRTLRGRRALVGVLLLGFVGPWLVFIKIAEEIWEEEGFPGDHYLLETVHQHATPTLDWLARALSTAGGPTAMLAITAALLASLWALGRRLDAAFFLTAVGGAMVLNVLVKTVFGRARPALWAALDPAPFYSFPSGHAMGSAALAVALGFLVASCRGRWLVWVLGGLFLLGMGWSRVYLGVHFLSDVLAGWVGSTGWVGGLHLLFSSYRSELRVWGQQVAHVWRFRSHA